MLIKRLNEDINNHGNYLNNRDFMEFLDCVGQLNSVSFAMNHDTDIVEDREVTYNDVLYYADWIDEISAAMHKIYNRWITDSNPNTRVTYGR